MTVWCQEVPYDDVYEDRISKTPRERLYDDYMNRMKQKFFGDGVRAPTRTLRRADELPPNELDFNQQVNSHQVGGRGVYMVCSIILHHLSQTNLATDLIGHPVCVGPQALTMYYISLIRRLCKGF